MGHNVLVEQSDCTLANTFTRENVFSDINTLTIEGGGFYTKQTEKEELNLPRKSKTGFPFENMLTAVWHY